MAGCNCSCGTSSFTTYEWVTMILQGLTALILALLLFEVDEKINARINN